MTWVLEARKESFESNYSKTQGSTHKINRTLWKYQGKHMEKYQWKKKVRLNKIYRIHPAQILKSFKVGQLQPNRTVLGWFRSNREQNLQTRMLAPFTYCKPRTLSIICWSSTLKSVSTKEMMGTIKKHQNKLDLVSSSSNSGRFEASDLSIAGYRQRWISVCSRQKKRGLLSKLKRCMVLPWWPCRACRVI